MSSPLLHQPSGHHPERSLNGRQQLLLRGRRSLAQPLLKAGVPSHLPAKMFAIAALEMAVNLPLGIWKEHTKKFSPSWFAAVHAAVPFIAMLRKSVLMPKSAVALTIGASILGQAIGSRAERIRLKAVAEKERVKTETTRKIASYNNPSHLSDTRANLCVAEGMVLINSLSVKDTGPTSAASVCY